MKVSFDWDSTLAEDRQQKIASKFIAEGHQVWIVTSRSENPPLWVDWSNKILFKTAEKLGIPKERIVFTGGVGKWEFLKDFDIHFDDDQIEIEEIEKNTNCVGVLIFDP